MTLERLKVIIEAQTSGLKKDMADIKNQLNSVNKVTNTTKSSISSMLGGYLKAASVILILKQVAQYTWNCTKEAMQVEAQVSNLSRTMGSSSAEFLKWAKTGAVSFGISESSAVKFGNAFSNLISGFIGDTKQVTAYTQQLLQASSVIASKTGRTIEDVNERIRSGLLGNTESIEDLGVNVNVAMLEMTDAFKQMSNGRSWEKLSFYEQQQIRLFAILEQSATKYGDTLSSSTATKMLMFQAQLSNMKLALGRAFLCNCQVGIRQFEQTKFPHPKH